MKRIGILFLCSLLLTACSEPVSMEPEDYTALDYVILPDYLSCEISNEDMIVTENDVTLSISMELQCMGITAPKENGIAEPDDILILTLRYTDDEESVTWVESELYYLGFEEYAALESHLLGTKTGDSISFYDSLSILPGYETHGETVWFEIDIEDIRVPVLELTEEIARDCFDGKTVQEVRDLFVTKIQTWRKWDIIETYLLENTVMEGAPPQKELYVENMMRAAKNYAVNQGMDLTAYLETIGLTEEEYREETELFYYEMMLYKALAEQEQLSCSEEDYQAKLTELAEGFCLSEEEVLEENGVEYVYYLYRYELLKESIPQKFEVGF